MGELKKDLKKEKKRVEKLQVQGENQAKNQINQKMIEETIQTIMIDVVDELTENEARQFEIFNRRINENEEVIENTRQQRNIQDKEINSELRRLGAIIDTHKILKNQHSPDTTSVTVPNSTETDDLRITVGSMQEK